MKSIKRLFLITLLTGSISVLAQGSPPAMAMPSEKISSINFEEFKKVAVYNDYSSLNTDELTLLID